MDKLRVLHIIKDDKFFDSVFNQFETVKQFENIAVLLVQKVEGYQFQYIKGVENVTIVKDTDFTNLLLDGAYDIVFFHSLTVDKYKYITRIPKNKIIIWWSWGYDLYNSVYGMRPLLEVNLFRPLTSSVINSQRGIVYDIKQLIKKILFSRYYTRLRQQVIERIDYFQPVIPLEYQLLKEIPGFNAKEFYYPLCFSDYANVLIDYKKNTNGSILIGNSQAPTNNHFDVWHDVNKYIPDGRDVIFPINYIGDKEYADEISNRIHSTSHNLHFLKDFMPKDEYFNMIDNCSYAIFGVMRQQAMGNINYCISHGIKVFLYRDSLVYRFLKENGYIVFAIEEIDENSFVTPLTHEEMELNAKAFAKEYTYIKNVQNAAFEELYKKAANQ